MMHLHHLGRRWLACWILCGALAAQGAGEHLLFDFDDGIEGWRTNVFGSGAVELRSDVADPDGGGALTVVATELRGGNVIGPALPMGTDWRLRRYDRVRFRARAAVPMTKARLVFITDEAAEPGYSLAFTMESTDWTEHQYPLSRCWNRAGRKLDAGRIKAVYVNPGQPDATFSVDRIALLDAAREVFLQPDRAVVLDGWVDTPPVLDGKLDDACWEQGLLLTDFVRHGVGGPSADRTEVRVLRDAAALYLSARLYSSAMDRLKATETARDAPVWQDDCLELFIDPGHSHRQWYQFVVNSIGSQYDALLPGGTEDTGVGWNCDWQAVCGREETAWTVEMRIPLDAFAEVPEQSGVWGFNVCREAPSTGELSMWHDTGGRFTRVWGFADLVFSRGAPAPACENVALEEKAPGDCILRFTLDDSTATVNVRVQAPGDIDRRYQVTAEHAGADGHYAVPIQFPVAEDGPCKLLLGVTPAAAGGSLWHVAYDFTVTLPRAASLDNLVLVPSPREMTLQEGVFSLDAETRTIIGGGERDAATAAVMTEEISRFYGLHPSARGHGDIPATNRILLGCPETSPAVRADVQRLGLEADVARLKPEGYVLAVTPDGVLIAGADDRGTYYGVRTFLQLVSHATAEGSTPQAPCCRIVDWPEHATRAYMLFTTGWPQDPFDIEELKEFIYRQVAGFKYNTLVWQMKAGYHYSRWPRLANRCAMSREELREVARFARDHFLEIIPNTNILGHANWIVLKYPELQEDGKPNQICTRHPLIQPMLRDILDEMIEVFDSPKRLHVGLDEVRWKTFNLPAEERCPRCRDVPKWEIYAEHVTALHEYLSGKGIEMWMWGDMLTPTHNGGPPFDCHKAIDLIPKDIVIANWSAEYAKGSCRMFAEAGFPVLKANSRQVPVEDAPYVRGNLASFWFRHPWCPMTQGGERGLMLETAYAAEFSWHTNRENLSLAGFARQADLNVLRLAARPPLPQAAAECLPVPIDGAANRSRSGETAEAWFALGPERDLRFAPAGMSTVGHATFDIPQERVLVLDQDSTGPVTIPLNRSVASMLFLHAVGFPQDAAARKAYLKAFLAPNEGVPVVTVELLYADGGQAEIPIRVGMEVGSWLPERAGEYLVRCPYILRAPTPICRKETPGKSDAVLYVFEWAHSQPKRRVRELRIRHHGGAAPYGLVALSARPPAADAAR